MSDANQTFLLVGRLQQRHTQRPSVRVPSSLESAQAMLPSRQAALHPKAIGAEDKKKRIAFDASNPKESQWRLRVFSKVVTYSIYNYLIIISSLLSTVRIGSTFVAIPLAATRLQQSKLGGWQPRLAAEREERYTMHACVRILGPSLIFSGSSTGFPSRKLKINHHQYTEPSHYPCSSDELAYNRI